MKLSEDTRKAIVSDYINGIKWKKILSKYGIGHSTLSRILKTLPNEMRRSPKLSKEKRSEISRRNQSILRLYRKGLSLEEIAKRSGCAVTTVIRVLKKFEDQIKRRRKKFSDAEKEQARKLYSKGFTIRQITKFLHRDRKIISEYLESIGLKTRKPKLFEQTIKIPPKDDLLYIAGLFDGEGYCHFDKIKGYQHHLGIANKNKEIMLWLKDKVGGFIYGSKHGKYGICWNWRIQRMTDIIIFLESIIPFLKIKKGVALKLLNECQKRRENHL